MQNWNQVKPSTHDYELLRILKARMYIEKKTTFTADDFYSYGLAIRLEEPRNRTVGAWFSRMSRAKEIVKTGLYISSQRTPNKGRMQTQWRFPEPF